MTEETKVFSDAQSAEAVNAAAIHAEAVEKARSAQIGDAVSHGLETFFQRSVSEGRFIPLTKNRMADRERFQFICDEIAETKIDVAGIKGYQIEMSKLQANMSNDLYWIKWLGGGFVAAAGMLAMKALGV